MDRRAFIRTAGALGLVTMLDTGANRVAASSLAFNLFLSSRTAQKPLLVMVHGVSTHPATLIELTARKAAEHRTTLMAPDFHVPLFGDYQRLGGTDRPLGAAQAFELALAEAARQLEMPVGPVDLMGFSGGAQFVHRFALFFPQRVRRLVVAAAGWYTDLDDEQPYPYGTGASAASGRLAPKVLEFLRIPKLVAVGERDVQRDRQLRRGDADAQGANRLERARRWVAQVNDRSSRQGLGELARLAVLPRTGHSVRQAIRQGGLADLMFDFLGDGQVPASAASRPRNDT